jgi:hypothetical protein
MLRVEFVNHATPYLLARFAQILLIALVARVATT